MKVFVLIYGVILSALSIHATCSSEPAPSAPRSEAVMESRSMVLSKEQLMGQFDPTLDSNFVEVAYPYTDRTGMLLRKEVYEAFKLMWEAAKKDNIELKIISSTRNFDQQKKIWEAKWDRYATETPDPKARALRILEYSSMPGTSRHHWGTDLDINDLNDASFVGKGVHRKVYEWMRQNAHRYGFGQPYTEKGADRPNGYNEEKWHWSYLPLSKKYREQYVQSVNEEEIRGFKGAETAVMIGVVKNYVSGVSLDCQ
jgi:LAS superfamily LD-carboxypeptidase LdcB